MLKTTYMNLFFIIIPEIRPDRYLEKLLSGTTLFKEYVFIILYASVNPGFSANWVLEDVKKVILVFRFNLNCWLRPRIPILTLNNIYLEENTGLPVHICIMITLYEYHIDGIKINLLQLMSFLVCCFKTGFFSAVFSQRSHCSSILSAKNHLQYVKKQEIYYSGKKIHIIT